MKANLKMHVGSTSGNPLRISRGECSCPSGTSPRYQSSQFRILTSRRSPAHPEVLAVKRVIGLPGDKVVTRAPYPMPTVDIPRNHIWVEGDNKDGSKTLDSNHYGPISTSLVQGKITHVLWPWNSAGRIRWWEFKGRTKVVKGRGED